MNFKTWVATFSVILLTSCSWIHNEPKSAGNFQSKSLDLGCVKAMPANLQSLFSGEFSGSNEDQLKVKDIFGCLDHALETFSSFTRGDDPSAYSSKELQNFANRYLQDSNRMSDGFVASIFQLKRAIIGGAERNLTQNEIRVLRQKLLRFGDIIAPFAPHLKVLVQRGVSDPATRHSAIVALNKFVLDLAAILSDSPNSLAWNDLTSFIHELERFTVKGQTREGTNALTLVREQLPIYQYVKLMVVGGSESSIETEKWSPIFRAISHFYSALFLTSSTSELLEQLSIEVGSTEEEQARATGKLNGILKVLIQDPNLNSAATVKVLADRYAKALLINAVLFPRSQGSLALRPFLETASLRKLVGFIIEEVEHLDRAHLEPAALQTIADNVISLLEQASISNTTPSGANVVLNLSRVIEYLGELKPLIESSTDFDTFLQFFKTLKSVSPVLIGKTGDALPPKDLRQFIQKGMDLYTTWDRGSKAAISEQIGKSLSLLIAPPSLLALSSNQLNETLDQAEKLVHLISPAFIFDWDGIRGWIKNGLKLKSVILQSSNQLITLGELSQLQSLYEPFRNLDDPAASLSDLASALQSKPLRSVAITDLIPAIDSLLPAQYRTTTQGFSAKIISDLKVLLVGGKPDVLEVVIHNDSRDKNDYADLARLMASLYKKISPILKESSKELSPGLNVQTLSLIRAGLSALIENRRGTINLVDVKTLLVDSLQKIGLTPSDATLEKFLTGFHTRILKQQKTKKPSSTKDLTFTASDLGLFSDFAENLLDDLTPLESSFRGLDFSEGHLPKETLLKKLDRPNAQNLLNHLLPLVNGKDHRLHFAAKGEVLDQFTEFDLAYKLTLLLTVQTIFPLYKVTDDPSGPKAARLNETDLTDLLTDLNDLVTELGLSYGYSPPEHSANVRMRSINLFTRNGNGDEYVDPIETTEFLTITLGGKKILQDFEKAIYPKCHEGVPNPDDVKNVSVACLNQNFFKLDALKGFYGQVTPQLINQMSSWKPETFEVFRKALLTSTNANWNTTGLIKREDIETLISIPYYVENLFQRFDLNQDDLMEFSEAMIGFPVFCREIKKSGGTSLKGSCLPGESPNQIEAVYGYLLFYGEAPRGIKKGDPLWLQIKSAREILSWFRYWRKLDRTDSVRDQNPPKLDRVDLLKIMSNLASSPAPT
jgi:hypothetical protein